MPTGELAFHATRVAGIWRRYARPKALGTIAAVVAAAVLVATQFPAGGNDDSHITYWAAHALSERGRIENYNGLAVEQSSSLSLVLLLGFVEWVTGFATPALGFASGLCFGGLTLVLVALLSPGTSKPAAFWPPVLLGTWLPFLYWSTSGMETTLVTFAGCATVFAAGRIVDEPTPPRRSLVAVLGLAAATFVLARPETPIELVCAFALCVPTLFVLSAKKERDARRTRVRRALVLLGSALALVLVVGLVRLHFFGLVVPNPAAAKSGAFALGSGADYLGSGLVLGGPGLAVLSLFGVVAVLATARERSVAAAAVLLVGWGASALAFVVASGGDWMPAARLLVPLGPALAVLAGEALGALARLTPVGAHAAGAVVVSLNVASALSFGDSGANGSYRGAAAHEGRKRLRAPDVANFSFSELANRAHRRDARLLGPLLTLMRRLNPSEQAPITLMSGQAGMVPYYVFREFYGRARFIDLYALTTPEILPCIPARHQKRKLQGVHISPGYVIDHADEMDAPCGAERPHVVFSTGRCPSYLDERGYACFYEGPRGMDAFVAVDRETLKRSRK
ncbi:MAG TPA: hypothetical protein VFZ53_11010 [Polyangiaceae bacterium]